MTQTPLSGLPNPLRKKTLEVFLYQEFQCGSETVELRASPGNAQTQERAFVLWDEIKGTFPAATRLQCGERIINFMTDAEGNRIRPLRIEYQQDSVIQVIESRLPSVSNYSTKSDTISIIARSIRSFRSQRQAQNQSETSSHMRSYQAPSIFSSWNTQERRHSSVNPSFTISASDEPTSRFRTSFYLYEAFLQSIHEGQSDQAETILNGLYQGRFSGADAHFPELNPDQRPQEAEVSTIQSRLQTILTQQYEWHHAPFPRLFVVLPKDFLLNNFQQIVRGTDRPDSGDKNGHVSGTKSWDLSDVNKFCSNFRLHFLCECGEHSRRNLNSTLPHHVHLTKHGGFDLNNPIEFFRRYGHYVMRMLQMLKYGVSVGGYSIPELETPKPTAFRPNGHSRSNSASSGTSSHHSSSNSSSGHSIEPAVNLTLEFLKYLGAIGQLSIPARTQQGNLQQTMNAKPGKDPEALGGGDLRRLVMFLRGVHSNKAIDSFYRIMTGDGHVRWVCREHFDDSYDSTLMKEFTEMMSMSKSIFDDRLGYVDVALKSSAMATPFYKIVERAQFIQELKVRLRWDVSMNDFKALRDAVLLSNIARLELSCSGSGGSAADILTRGKKSDPLWQMIIQSKLQAFVLSGYGGFFSRVTVSAKKNTLRILKIMERIDWKKEHGKVVEWLENSPQLRELLLRCTDIQEAYKTIRKLNYETCSLTQLILDGGDTNGVQAWFERGVPIAMDLVVSSLSDPLLKDSRILRALHVRPGLHVPSEIDPQLLTMLIPMNSNLTKMIVQCGASQFLQLHIAVKETLNNDESSKLNTLRLYGACNQLTITDIQGNASTELELMTMNASASVMDSLLKVYGNRLTKFKVEENILKSLFDMAFQGIPMLLKHIEVVGSRMTPNMCYELRKIVECSKETLQHLSIQLDKPWANSVQSEELATFVVDLGPMWSKIRIPDTDRETWLNVLADRGFKVPPKSIEKLDVFRLREHVQRGTWELGGGCVGGGLGGGERVVEKERRFGTLRRSGHR
ncbi:MAG: hypothetical protein J3Q66DRAFT_332582 [Benniella sp.]|nr:MAG: hypothetical protein J3Q66DRAFT_332582 [Benniella sp.]